MRYCIIIFSFLQLSLSYGQDLQNLDRKFGIKKFRLESSIALYKSQIQFLTKENNGTSYYKYLGTDMDNLFNVPIEEVGLIFYKNILYSISITFAQTSEMNEKIVNAKLKDLFGNPFTGTGKEKVALDYEWAYIWDTKKTYLQYSKYTLDSRSNPNQLEIFMYSKKMNFQIANDNF